METEFDISVSAEDVQTEELKTFLDADMWSTLKEVIMQKIKAGAAATQKGPSATPADHDEVPPDSHCTRASDS
eukprot:4524681-Pyramimonas_sp.AAC.1